MTALVAPRTVPTVLNAWTSTLLRALAGRGIDGVALAAQAGIPRELLEGPDQRLPLDASTRFWKLAAEATGDEAFGIEVSRYARPTAFHALGPAFVASPTLRRALERAARFGRVTADTSVGAVELTGSELGWHMTWPGSALPAAESLDAIASTIVRTARFLLDDSVSPTRLALTRSEPQRVERYDRFFRCPITYDSPGLSIHFDREVAERRIPGGSEAIAGASENVVAAYLDAQVPGSVTDRVRLALADLMPSGEPAVAEVARLLGLSSRTLQRHLGDEGTSFRQVLRDVRHDLARRYLADPSVSVTEVAFLLGFSETAAFSRAFKRWTGDPPSRLR